MDNVEQQTETTAADTEVSVERQSEPVSIRDALKRSFKAEDDPIVVETKEDPDAVAKAPQSVTEQQTQEATPAVEKIPLVPPADMNKAEKEAFLNPTPDNAHVLQQYMNRRAYETRSDYQRKMVEVEELKKQTSSIYDAVKQYENDYAKEGISIADLTRRSIAWDKAMMTNPVETALEWLDAYGIKPEQLFQGYDQQGYYPQQQPAQYLTMADAERIAEEKIAAMQQQQEQKAVAYYNERVVESFIANKPLFKDAETAAQLEAEMAPIVAALTQTGKYSGPEQILETAYNYVVAGNPTFSSIANAITAKAQVEQTSASVQKAKAASRSITGSAGSGTPRVQAKNIRDNLRARMTGD